MIVKTNRKPRRNKDFKIIVLDAGEVTTRMRGGSEWRRVALIRERGLMSIRIPLSFYPKARLACQKEAGRKSNSANWLLQINFFGLKSL